MGVVYEARDEHLQRNVALKLLKDGATHNEELRARFLREARSAAAVSHRSIAMVHEIGEDEGRVFIAMELVQGETLAARIARGPLPIREAASVALEVAAGLAKAHDAGILHRDLKPGNVMIDEDGGVKILDFGLARTVDDAEAAEEEADTVSALTEYGRVMGTPGYMAPEQAEGAPVSRQTDLFAFGTLLYEMLSGEMAFGGRSTAQRIAATLKDEPKALTDIVDVPQPVADLVQACFRKEPSQRPESARAIANTLRNYAEATTSPPAPSTAAPSTAAPSTADGVPSHVSVAKTSPRPDSSKPKGWLIGLGVAIAIAGAAAIALTLRAPTPAPAAATPRSDLIATLMAADATVACPLFAVEGHNGPSGRLGAAMAAQTCGVLDTLLGEPERTRSPAQLLDLPVGPVDDFPAHPYAAKLVRARTLSAAREHTAWMEGTLVVGQQSFHAVVQLVTDDGPQGEAGSADAALPVTAVRDAVVAAMQSLGLPTSPELDPNRAALFDLKTKQQALHLMRLQEAISSGRDVKENCRAIATLSPVMAAARAEQCGHRQRRDDGLPSWPASLAEKLAGLPPTSRGWWRTALLLRTLKDDAAKTMAADLEALRAKAEPGMMRAYLDFAIAILEFRLGSMGTARARLDRIYREYPRLCEIRNFAVQATFGAGSRLAITRAASGWCPNSATAWEGRYGAGRGEDRDVEQMRTAFYLKGGEIRTGVFLVDALLIEGRVEEARTIASRYIDDRPPSRAANAYVLARVEIHTGQLGAGVARLERAIAELPRLGGHEYRLADWSLVHAALSYSEVIGEQRRIANMLLERFILPTPAKISSGAPLWPALAAAHASPEVAKKAIKRIRELVATGELWPLPQTEGYLTGLEALHAGDARAAVEAWRPFVGAEVLGSFILTQPFDEVGEIALASALDERVIEEAGHVLGMAHVRQAKRAAARGDKATARKLAETIVAAWTVADVKVSAVDDMRKLLSEL